MEIASTDTKEYRYHRKKNKEREQNYNFWIALLQGIFIRISFAFADPPTVLSAFIYQLTRSDTLVGLTGSIMSAGWMWPQLLISNLLEHRPRKMPFYVLGMSIRVVTWVAIVLCTLLISSHNDNLLALSFLSFYFLGASAMGISTIPYMDIISKSIEPQRRARFFSLRQFIGGIFAVFIGFFVRYILGDQSGLMFPNNYALLFGCALVAFGLAFVIFIKLREPLQPVQTGRRPLRQHLQQGPYLLRTDADYRRFLFFRSFAQTAGMCVPFYVPYALLRLNVPDSTIGSFIAVVALSGVISNAVWGYVGERYGVRWILIGTSVLACVVPFTALSIKYLPAVWQVPCYFLVFIANGASMNGMMVGSMTYMLNIAPNLGRPTYIGFMNTILFPFSFMPVIAGKLVGLINYEGIFLVALGMAVVALFTATQLREVYRTD